MSSDSITFWRLKNLHVAMPAKAQSHFLQCEARRPLQNFSMASLILYIPTEVSSLEQFSPLNSRDPLLCHVDPKSNPPRSPPISLLTIPAYTSLPRTTVWYIQNWSLPLTRLGRAHTWLVVAHVRPGCLSKNRSLIWFRWHIQQEDYRLPLDIASNYRLPRTQFPNQSPKS
jgi:hypothetical protein